MIKIIAKFQVKPEKIYKFRALGAELVESSRAEAGNLSYTMNVNTTDPLLYAFIEVWKDQAAIDSHNASEHFTRLFPQLEDMVFGIVRCEFYTEVV